MTPDINVYVIDFKNTKVSETVTHNDDGSYSIFLNARMNQEKRCDAYLHALSHILKMDFESVSSADTLEHIAHRKRA